MKTERFFRIFGKKILMISSICLAFLIYGDIRQAKAATYYVDKSHTSASNSNPGSESLPWKTMIYGVAQLVAGDTLYVKNGTYATTVGADWYKPGIRPLNSGTAANPITIKAYPGHQPVIDGTTADHATVGSHNEDYIVYDGFKTYYAIFYFNECSHITIQNCEMQYGRNKGGADSDYTNMVELRYVQYANLNNNIIYRNNWTGGGTNKAAIILHWCDYIIMEHNYFYDNHIAYRNKCGSGGTYGHRNIFRYNLVRDCAVGVHMGGYGGASTDNEIYQNIFLDTSCGVLVSIGNSGLKIMNNTFYHNDGFEPGAYYGNAVSFGNGSVNSCPDNEIYNNIISNIESPITNNDDASNYPSNIYCNYNDYHAYDGFEQIYSLKSYAEFVSEIGGNVNSLNDQDPKFIDPPDNFRFPNSSPCYHAGKNGVNMGCYITGGEIIGPTSQSVDTTPPAPPTGLIIVKYVIQ